MKIKNSELIQKIFFQLFCVNALFKMIGQPNIGYLICDIIIFTYICLRNKFEFKISKQILVFIMMFLFAISITVLLNFRIDSLIILLSYMLFFICGYNFYVINSEKCINTSLNVLYNFIVICSIYGLIEFGMRDNPLSSFFYQQVFPNSIGTISYRLRGIFVHPIIYANILLLGIWINIFKNSKSKKNYLELIVLIINLIGTQTRSAIIVFVFTFILYFFKNYKSKRLLKYTKWIFLLSSSTYLLIKCTSMGKTLFERIVTRMSSISTLLTSSQRSGTIDYIFNDVLTNSTVVQILVGRGFKGSTMVMTQTTINISDFSATDNQYLAILVDFGFIFFILFIVYFIFLIINFLNTNNKVIEEIFMLQICNFAMMAVYDAFTWSPIAYLIFMFMGILTKAMSQKKQVER